MKKILTIVAIFVVPICICAYQPVEKGIKFPRMTKNIKGLKINCAKAKKEVKEKNKNRKKADWPPTSP